MRSLFSSAPLRAAFAFSLLLGAAAPGQAQTAAPGALPTAPAADRASEGGYTAAKASLPGEAGHSPLEPYLITWLLPASGILSIIAAVAVDRKVRGSIHVRTHR